MKFLVSKNIHENPNFVLLIGFYSLLLLCYFAGDLVYLSHFFGTSPSSVLVTLKGNEDEFIEPLSLLSFLEHFHISMFISILAIFTTMAIILRLSIRNTHKSLILILSMGSVLLSALSLLISYFFIEGFVYLFIFTTLIWHLSGLYAVTLTLYELGRKRKW